jgi:hypothetical protein
VTRGTLSRFGIKWNGKEEVWLMLQNGAVSIEHRVCVQKIHEALNRHGLYSYITCASNGPDIFARVDNDKVAIEYETGRKSLQESAKMIRSRAGEYDRVAIFVNSRAFRFYKSYFESGNVTVFDIGSLEGETDIAMHRIFATNDSTSQIKT